MAAMDHFNEAANNLNIEDRVRVLDDEEDGDAASVTSSTSSRSYRSYRRPRHYQRPPRRPVTQTMRVDGKIPDVLHVCQFIDWQDAIVSTQQSLKAFKEMPVPEESPDQGYGDEGFDNPNHRHTYQTAERPVLEILTKVYSRRNRRRVAPPPPPRRYETNHRPITAFFDQNDHRYDGYLSDTDPVMYDRWGWDIETAAPVMVIHSKHLANALHAAVAYYPYLKLNGDHLMIPAPYCVLYHHRQELAAYRDNQPACHSPEDRETTTKHTDVLLNFLAEADGPEIAQEEALHKLATPMATYDYFWLLLKPGQVVYAKRYDIWTAFVISSVNGGHDVNQPYDNYKVNCWLLESNGVKVDRYMESFTVAPWLGEQAISSLSVVPAAFWKEDVDNQHGLPMREKFIAEGRLYWDLLKHPTYMEYDGQLVSSATGNRQVGGPTGFMCGRVICDAPGFYKFFDQAPDYIDQRHHGGARRATVPVPPKDHLPKSLPRCGCDACAETLRPINRRDSPYIGFEDLDPLHDSPPENELFYLVLSNSIPGFILGSRRWGHLNLQHLKPVKSDKEAFKYLVLDDDIKLTVKALIGKFTTGIDGKINPWGNDFVKNKGEGRIFLLHGAPGVGKTCTAECIAELTNRPLISLTSGDLSVDAYRVENNLSYFLELGQRYGALVLLDEADVYLERRRSKDIDRNGLVGVFLRALEYYRGVLFLTTNRVQSFDGAFLSRIHVALHYKNLRDEDRERIWTNHFDRLSRDSEGHIQVSSAARDFMWESRDVRSLSWNGREIRNAMQTALALAENDAEEQGIQGTVIIGEKHIRAVVKMSRGFKDFIKREMPNGGKNFIDDISDID